MYKVGEIIRPRKGETPLPMDHYRVRAVGYGSAHLTQLFVLVPRPENMTTERVTFIPRTLFAGFDLVEEAE